MKIHLTPPGVEKFWLAGHDHDPEWKRGSVNNFQHKGDRLFQSRKYLRGEAGDFSDRKNFTTTLTFSTRRTFENSGEAFLFVSDYDRTSPREGLITQLVENPDANGGFEERYLPDSIVDPPSMTIRGCTVDMQYTVRGKGHVVQDKPA